MLPIHKASKFYFLFHCLAFIIPYLCSEINLFVDFGKTYTCAQSFFFTLFHYKQYCKGGGSNGRGAVAGCGCAKKGRDGGSLLCPVVIFLILRGGPRKARRQENGSQPQGEKQRLGLFFLLLREILIQAYFRHGMLTSSTERNFEPSAYLIKGIQHRAFAK